MLTQPDVVYHHTDTARLPYILRSGVLLPGSNRIGGYPDPDFLWTTTDPRGDATSSANKGDPYRSGKIRHVRFALPKALFFPWAEAPARFPAWIPKFVESLEAVAASRGSSPSAWWCRSGFVPLTECMEIATRSYRDNRWRPLDQNSEVVDTYDEFDGNWLMMSVEGQTIASRRYIIPNGPEAYEVRAGSPSRLVA